MPILLIAIILGIVEGVNVTKPVPSPSASPAAIFAATASVPGTVTEAGTDGRAPCARVSDTVHAPAPPPASLSAIEIVLAAPGFSRPNEALDRRGEDERSVRARNVDAAAAAVQRRRLLRARLHPCTPGRPSA